MDSFYNIENHPFIKDIFLFFDKNEDTLVDFQELIFGLDIVERGTFEEKCRYTFDVYDIYQKGVLDVYTLRALLKRSFSSQIINLETCIKTL